MTEKQCSNMFLEVFGSHTAGCVRTCGCGITYFHGDEKEGDWEKGELEELRYKAKKNEQVIEWNCPVSTMNVFGYELVIGCTCKYAKHLEDILLNYPEQIAEYLNKRASLLREKAERIQVNLDTKDNIHRIFG
jgi:hypothetical protein